MSSTPNPRYISVEEYLRTDYEPACEYVDGVLIPKYTDVRDYRRGMSPNQDAPVVSVEEYLRGDCGPACEYIDGVLEPKSMGDFLHGRLQALLGRLLVDAEARLGTLTCLETHVRVTPRRYRIPDLAVYSRPFAVDRYAENVPLFTIEVLSPDDPLTTLLAKIADQLSMGTSLVIAADPHSRTVYTARPGLGFHEVAPPLTVSIDVPERGTLAIDFDELFSQLD